jgi:hypothetical protein
MRLVSAGICQANQQQAGILLPRYGGRKMETVLSCTCGVIFGVILTGLIVWLMFVKAIAESFWS